MLKPWETLRRTYLIRRWWMNFRVDHVRLPSGTELPEFHVVEYPDWACVVCLTESGELVMVEQYRYGIGEMSLEFPSGSIDENEDPLVACKRELLEETGYEAEGWIPLGKVATEPSKHTNYAHFFFARKARRVQAQHLDESEDIRVRVISLEEAFHLAETGGITHGLHLTALFWAQQRGLLKQESS